MTKGVDDDEWEGDRRRFVGKLLFTRAQKRPEPSRVRAMSWMFAGGTLGGDGAYEERRERPAAKL
jgi:hypothetical protein